MFGCCPEYCLPSPLVGEGRRAIARRSEGLTKEGSFKAAEARYTATDQVDVTRLRRWLAKARDIQWDYKNIVRRKGRLERLK